MTVSNRGARLLLIAEGKSNKGGRGGTRGE